jgi:hypothetical protein
MNLPRLKDGFYWDFNTEWASLITVRCFGKRRYWFDKPIFATSGWSVADVSQRATELAAFSGVIRETLDS